MLYIMRHGKTDWNVKYKLQGRVDIPLNDEGRQMAVDARERYKDVHFDICYCSPLVRARETADIFLEGRDIKIIEDKRLLEMGFGECEGIENVLEKEDCAAYTLFHDPANYVPGVGGETLEELYARTGSFIKEIALPEVESGKDVLIIGHGAMNSSFINQIKGIPLERFWENGRKNCELIQII